LVPAARTATAAVQCRLLQQALAAGLVAMQAVRETGSATSSSSSLLGLGALALRRTGQVQVVLPVQLRSVVVLHLQELLLLVVMVRGEQASQSSSRVAALGEHLAATPGVQHPSSSSSRRVVLAVVHSTALWTPRVRLWSMSPTQMGGKQCLWPSVARTACLHMMCVMHGLRAAVWWIVRHCFDGMNAYMQSGSAGAAAVGNRSTENDKQLGTLGTKTGMQMMKGRLLYVSRVCWVLCSMAVMLGACRQVWGNNEFAGMCCDVIEESMNTFYACAAACTAAGSVLIHQLVSMHVQ
jgi:hypothetical protein